MKTKLFLILTIALSLFLAACEASLPAAAPADPLDPDAMSPEEVVESFYNWYMEYPGNPTFQRAYHDSPYLSEDFKKELDDTLDNMGPGGGADPIILAQDRPNHLEIGEAVIDGSTASLQVTSDWPDHILQVRLAVIAGEWQIVGISK